MAEIKDKIVTVESLSALHEYNKAAYASTWVDLGNAPIQYNPSDFISFVVEFVDEINNEIRYITFTNKTSNNSALDTIAKAFEFDNTGNIQIYELYFYWGDGGHMVELTASQYVIGTGEATTPSSLSYNKVYGVKYS